MNCSKENGIRSNAPLMWTLCLPRFSRGASTCSRGLLRPGLLAVALHAATSTLASAASDYPPA